MIETAEVIVMGAGVQGASLAFHLAQRGARVIVVERETVAAGATGRSSGFVRMHYDLASDARLAWASFPYFDDWPAMVGHGDCAFVRTGFLQIMPDDLADNARANVATQQAIGIDTHVVGPADVADLVPGIATGDFALAVHEPRSGYADPSGTAAGFLAAARALGARVVQDCPAIRVLVEGERVAGVETTRGRFGAPIVVDVAGAWAAALARTVGVEIPVQTWRHDTAYFGLPAGRTSDFPIVIDEINEVYFRPEGHETMLVGLEGGNDTGGSPDRPLSSPRPDLVEDMVRRVCARVPWMADGTLRSSHGGQDGITPDQHGILGQAGPDGFYLACGFSGTGFKTAPAIGRCMTELILDGRATTVDIGAYSVERFAAGRPLVGEHPVSTAVALMADPTETAAARRARLEDTFAREDDFGVVLILILLTIVSFAAANGAIGQLVSVALSGGTLLFVLHTAGARKRPFRIAAVIVTLAVLGTAIALIAGDAQIGRSAASLVGLLLAVVAPLVILRRIVMSPRITVRLVFGALAIYLLFGLAYAYLFPLISILTDAPFFVQTATPESIDYAYFSYTTLATIGYGDFTAATSVGRMIAVSEGLVGQLFLVSAVALLVGNVGRTLRPSPPTDAPPAVRRGGHSARTMTASPSRSASRSDFGGLMVTPWPLADEPRPAT